MQATVEVTMGGAPPHRAVLMCARDLTGVLERRAGPVELCEVNIQPQSDAERVRVELRVSSQPLELRLTLFHDADVYIALARSFDRAADLLIELRKCSPAGLLYRWSTRVAARHRSAKPHPGRAVPTHSAGGSALPAS